MKVRLLPGKEKLPANRHPWIFSSAIRPDDRARLSALDGGDGGDGAVRNTGPRTFDLRDPERRGSDQRTPDPRTFDPQTMNPRITDQQTPDPQTPVIGGTGAACVEVCDATGRFLGWGWVNPRSQILVRLVSFRREDYPDEAYLGRTIRAAFALRRRLGLLGSEPTTVCRLIFAESDGIPGLVVDRLGGYVAVQFENAGAEANRGIILPALVCAVRDCLPDTAGIWENSSGDGRKTEGLAPVSGRLWGEAVPRRVEVLERGLRFAVDPNGQKTGFYADQRENRALAAEFADGARVVDVCSYTGAFSVYAGRAGAASLVLVDSSRDALDAARVNLDRNGIGCPAEFVRADAFEYLRKLEPESADLVIFDPPKLAPTKAAKERALRAYKDGILHALRALAPGGVLAAFSCSQAVSAEDFARTAAYAAKDADRRVQILRRLSQAPCHPVLTSFPEAEYLKGLILRAL